MLPSLEPSASELQLGSDPNCCAVISLLTSKRFDKKKTTVNWHNDYILC